MRMFVIRMECCADDFEAKENGGLECFNICGHLMIIRYSVYFLIDQMKKIPKLHFKSKLMVSLLL